MSFFYRQPDQMACGATCLKMIAKYYGKVIHLDRLLQLSSTTRDGATLKGLIEAADAIGFKITPAKLSVAKLVEFSPVPCIVHWNHTHYVVLHKITKNYFHVADPAHGMIKYTKREFVGSWMEPPEELGVLLILEPTQDFYKNDGKQEVEDTTKSQLAFFTGYLKPHQKSIYHLCLGLFIGSILQLFVPFLTQGIVDIGIQNKDLGFIYIIYLAQLMMFLGRTSIDVIRNFILTYVNNKIGISIASDFFTKLMRLPISFFDVKRAGDIMQRIQDTHRIENFLTGSSLNTLFSLFNFAVFSVVLAIYSTKIMIIFFVGSVLYFLWLAYFLKKRAELDFKLFQSHSENQSKIVEIITGMQEIKLQNAEKLKRTEWENVQIKLFGLNVKGLKLRTIQNTGAGFINEVKNILIMFIATNYVLDNNITLGMLLAVSYIIGQLNGPVSEMAAFIHQWQDAKLSLQRLAEIHAKPDEESSEANVITDLNPDKSIHITNVSFKYNLSDERFVIDDINILLPQNKVTAIVGASGSGKTTFLKLLLKYYPPSEGAITIGGINLNTLSHKLWRKKVGAVMQEGFIFSDSIANNIATGVDEKINVERLNHAIRVANIDELVDSLPLNYNTKIGAEGLSLSTGQKQRILIARAVYKDPDFLIFDEATSALDSKNEKIIIENMQKFYKGRTAIIVAHRLSTVKNADNILVFDCGKIVEQGTHTELVTKKGIYFDLVKNQLELSNS